jgi:hypothetical protein
MLALINVIFLSGTIFSAPVPDFSDDVLIITHPDYSAAAETLATWQRMKGYDVKIQAQSVWDTTGLKQFIKTWYDNATVKPGYLVIVGDIDKVPSFIRKTNWKPYPTDLYYGTMDGALDFVSELAQGRLSVSSAPEAMTVVKKIIGYEKEPPSLASFYTNMLAAAYFQDGEKDGYEDMPFVRTIEEVRQYIAKKGYTTTRVYSTDNGANPANWDKTIYAFGEALPADLKKPVFAWSGNKQDIAKAINAGTFLVCHYDHGMENGWNNPEFLTADLGLLTNGNKLPLIISMDCLVGAFDYAGAPCFAEAALRKDNGGAVGVIAASALSYPGNNDAFLEGMIDAIWPGIVLKTPQFPNVPLKEHPPIYCIGDIIRFGMQRMPDQWSDSARDQNNMPTWRGMTKYHNEIYHYFGDPTMRIWTKEPQTIVATHAQSMPSNAKTFTVSGMNVSSGAVTLFDNGKKEVVGKGNITGASLPVPVIKQVSVSGTVTLTITSPNYRPYNASLTIGPTGIVSGIEPVLPLFSCVVKNKTLQVRTAEVSDVVISLYSLKGSCIYSVKKPKTATITTVIDINTDRACSGMYFVICSSEKNTFRQRVYIAD